MTKQFLCGLAVVAVAMATLAIAPVSAETIVPVSAIDDTTANSYVAWGTVVANLIDNTTATWVTYDNPPDYFENGGPDPEITFGLGGTYNLTDLVLSPYSVSGNRISEVDVSFSTTGTGGTFSGVVTLAPADQSSTETLSLGGTVEANAVRLLITDNYGGAHVAATEVNFEGTLVPEPSTFILATLGLLGLLACGRRRR